MARGRMLGAEGLSGPRGYSLWPFAGGSTGAHSAPSNPGGAGSSLNAFEGARGMSAMGGAVGRSLYMANTTPRGGPGIPIGQKMTGKDASLGRLGGSRLPRY